MIEVGSIQKPRKHFSMGYNEKYIYIVGGYNDLIGPIKDCEAYAVIDK
jgi:hypothetical protein